MFYPLALPEQLRRFYLFFSGLWLFFFLPVVAQPAPPSVRVDRLPPAGLLRQKGWRYHPGDNPAWARPDFDDSAWDTITVDRLNIPLPQRARAGAGWFRLHLRLADSLRYQALGLVMGKSLASFEVYVAGRRMGHSGIFSANPTQVQPAGSPPHPLDLVLVGTGPEVVLAVRFAPWQPPRWLRAPLAENKLLDFELRLRKMQQIRQDQRQARMDDSFYALLGGVFLLLGLLHLAFLRYNPARRTNGYFAFYALVSATGSLLTAFYPSDLALGASLAIASIRVFLYYVGLVAGLRALYGLFELRPGWVYKALWLIICLLVPVDLYSNLSQNDSLWDVVGVSVLVVVLELRLLWLAVRQRRRGSLLVGTGVSISLVVLILIVLLITLFPSLLKSTFFTNAAVILARLSSVAPVLSISLYLAREFARDAELLQVKLGEVEYLSAQTLAQEQEKQALLAQQNETLETQVQQRTGDLQRSLTDLRVTQAQLIQKEKMASLGELTAGIAHEIQNPLNFVNNFADVSVELLDELAEAQVRPTPDTGLQAVLVGDLRRNMEKITQHGQRAASIVRGMLEHSRTNAGERAPTDVNALADEYLRLAYHGLRAKDKSFNAELRTAFALALPLVGGVSADLGRVLLNLFNNAFYAVQQRALTGEVGYVPTVEVSTQQVGQQVEICVRDNGTGMSERVQAKIFQPFFTTKPPGEGTGLGLSLAHDIIAQGHAGSLRVESQSGEGSTFHIRLPALQ